MSRLTPAEEAALRAWWDQHGNIKEAAFALRKSPRTVEQQIASARRRLGARSTPDAVRRGIIDRDAA